MWFPFEQNDLLSAFSFISYSSDLGNKISGERKGDSGTERKVQRRDSSDRQCQCSLAFLLDCMMCAAEPPLCGRVVLGSALWPLTQHPSALSVSTWRRLRSSRVKRSRSEMGRGGGYLQAEAAGALILAPVVLPHQLLHFFICPLPVAALAPGRNLRCLSEHCGQPGNEICQEPIRLWKDGHEHFSDVLVKDKRIATNRTSQHHKSGRQAPYCTSRRTVSGYHCIKMQMKLPVCTQRASTHWPPTMNSRP